MAPYTAIFSLTLLLNAAATFRSSVYWKKTFTAGVSSVDAEGAEDKTALKSSDMEEQKSKHSALLRRYLAVYLLAAISDWLQGPYVYALYDSYGYPQHVIAILFVAGFGSSMIFGSFIGGLADSCGRRKFTVLYAVIYAGSCLTKHFKSFWFLMLGRILGGIATSLLFSVFDSWLIRSHNDAGVSSLISKSFSAAAYGNSVVAILAGLLANAASSGDMIPMFSTGTKEDALLWKGGYLNPFDIALFTLICCGLLASFLWEENYGVDKLEDSIEDTPRKSAPWYFAFTSAIRATTSSTEVLLCGLVCSLFEGSMYIFVFMWTPAMKDLTKMANPDFDGDLPFGLIFSTFMVCCMAGSSTFSVLIENGCKVEQIGLGIFCVAACAFGMMVISHSDVTTFLAFLLFEVCVGVYFPTMGTMKSIIVPENKRAAIYNLYRIPLNFIVLTSLLTDLSYGTSFFICTLMLATAAVLQWKLIKEQQSKLKSVPKVVDEEDGIVTPLLTSSNSGEQDDEKES